MWRRRLRLPALGWVQTAPAFAVGCCQSLLAAPHFDAPQAKRVQPFTMPLMSLAATAIDQPKDREAVIEAMLQYLHTDPVCCRHEPGKLADRQNRVRRLLKWRQA